jgi:hypothetical protein
MKMTCKIKVGDAAKVEVDAYLKNNLKVSLVFLIQLVRLNSRSSN